MRSRWKFWKKVASGCDSDWKKSSRESPRPKAEFPPLSQQSIKNAQYRTLRIQSTVGKVSLRVLYGQDPVAGVWLCPLRQVWGLQANQTMSPALEEKVCFTVTMTPSFEKGAAVAAKWGSPVDDATIHRHVAQAGERAENQAEERVARRAEVVAEAKAEAPGQEFSLVLMLDGWMIRERGDQWGLKPPEIKAERVSWREMKSAIVFRLDQRAQTQSGRPMILEKFYVAHRGDPEELGRRLYAEALRRGLHQAAKVYVVADGGVWIWNLVADRFSQAVGVLDFYHASGHLWAVAHALFGEQGPEARQWVEPLLHQLAHGGEAGVLRTLDDLLGLCRQLEEERQKTIEREVAYFQSHREHLHYQAMEKAGCPKGSGAMESTCSQYQDRFKRTGQFWTRAGEHHLLALELARRNQDWDEIWSIPHQQNRDAPRTPSNFYCIRRWAG
jgi:hypothetical protein